MIYHFVSMIPYLFIAGRSVTAGIDDLEPCSLKRVACVHSGWETGVLWDKLMINVRFVKSTMWSMSGSKFDVCALGVCHFHAVCKMVAGTECRYLNLPGM